MPAIDEVAERAGVARGTVSKALSSTYNASPRTRAKVEQAAAELGYRPNLAARALSKGRTFVVGLLIPYDSDQLFADPHLLDIIRGVEAAANRWDYNVLLSTAHRPNAKFNWDVAEMPKGAVLKQITSAASLGKVAEMASNIPSRSEGLAIDYEG